MCGPLCGSSSTAIGRWTRRALACALLFASTLCLSIGCSTSGARSSAEVNLVRNGFLRVRLRDGRVRLYDSATVGSALERKFTNGVWRQFTSSGGVVVEFDAAVLPATLYRDGFSVWSAFLNKTNAAIWGVPDESGSLSDVHSINSTT